MDTKLQEALDLIAAALGGAPASATPTKWFHATGLPPTVPLEDVTNEAELKRYASFGFKADLSRGVAPSDLAHMVTLCDQIFDAPTPTAAEAVIQNAGKFPPDVACYFLLTGATQGFSPFLTPNIFAPDAIQTVADAGLYATRKWTGGAGPGLG